MDQSQLENAFQRIEAGLARLQHLAKNNPQHIALQTLSRENDALLVKYQNLKEVAEATLLEMDTLLDGPLSEEALAEWDVEESAENMDDDATVPELSALEDIPTS